MASGQIDIENTYTRPGTSGSGGNYALKEEDSSSSLSCCCCFSPSTNDEEKDGGNQNKQKKKEEIEEEKKKELNRGLCGTRWSTILMMALWIFCVIISRINLDWSGIECDMSADDDSVEHDCIVNSAVFRASSVVVFLFGVQVLISPCFVHIFDEYWILKIIYCVGATAGLLVPYGANFFDDSGYAYIARIGAFIFIIFLQTLVLDFAYYWKQSWIDRSTVSGRMTSATLHGSDVLNVMSSLWHCALLVVSLLYLIIFVIAMAVLFTFFGGDGCAESNSILTITLVLMVAALILQMFLTKNGSIIASGILAAYVAYVAFSAVSLNPDRECNPTIGTKKFYGLGPQIIGLAISFCSIFYISGMTSRRMAAVMGAGGVAESGMINVATGSHSGIETASAKKNLRKQLRVTVMNLNIVFILISFYISMILTNWGTTISSNDESHDHHAGNVSMWMQAVGGWIAIAFYMLGLIMPHFKLLPDSIWDLQPKF